MTKLVISKDRISVVEAERYVSGTENAYKCSVTFSKDWEGLDRSICFRASFSDDPCDEIYASVKAPAMSMSFTIPNKIFAKPATRLKVTATGSRKGNKVKVLGTPWASLGRIIPGADTPCPDDTPDSVLIPPGGKKDEVLAKASDADYDFYWMRLNSLPTYGPTVVSAPLGSILYWSGSIDTIPDGWALCDGQNGTPDLRDRFIVGASEDLPIGPTSDACAAQPEHAMVTIPSYALAIIMKTSGTEDDNGKDGKSAYEIAVEHGFEGTEEDWLKSLEGKSAYDLAVESGYTGSVEDLSKVLNAVSSIPITSSISIASKDEIPSDGAGSYLFVDTTIASLARSVLSFKHDLVYLDDSEENTLRITKMDGTIYNCYFNDAGRIASIEELEPATGKGEKGDPGKSAYEIAVDSGFSGTETEWLASLKGEKGDDGKSAYQLAVDSGYIGTVDEWLSSLKGEDGKSAYEIAVENGFAGTEQEWIDKIQNGSAAELFPRVSGVINNISAFTGYNDGRLHSGVYYFEEGSYFELVTGEHVTAYGPNIGNFRKFKETDAATYDACIDLFPSTTTLRFKTDSNGGFSSYVFEYAKQPASSVTYDDTDTNLGATDMQEVTVKLKAAIDAINIGGSSSENPFRQIKNLSIHSFSDFPAGFEFRDGCYRVINTYINNLLLTNEVVYLDFDTALHSITCYQITGVKVEWRASSDTDQLFVYNQWNAYPKPWEITDAPFKAIENKTFTSVKDLTDAGISSGDLFYARKCYFKVAGSEDNIVTVYSADFVGVSWVNSMVVTTASTSNEYGIYFDSTNDDKPFTSGEQRNTDRPLKTIRNVDFKTMADLEPYIHIDELALHLESVIFWALGDHPDVAFHNDVVFIRRDKAAKKVYIYTIDNRLITITADDTGTFASMTTEVSAGKSAYDIAVEEGFTGTKAQWLASLKGEQGDSAYEIAQKEGYQGTIDEWLTSLKGAAGVDGKSVWTGTVKDGVVTEYLYEELWTDTFLGRFSDDQINYAEADLPEIGTSGLLVASAPNGAFLLVAVKTADYSVYKACIKLSPVGIDTVIPGGTYTNVDSVFANLSDCMSRIDELVTFESSAGDSVNISPSQLIYSERMIVDSETQYFLIYTSDGRRIKVTFNSSSKDISSIMVSSSFEDTVSEATYELARSQLRDYSAASDPIVGRWTDKRPIYRRLIQSTVSINSNEVTITTIPDAELVAPITGFIDGQNGSALYTIPGSYTDFHYGISFIKDTGEIVLYASTTSISEKLIVLYVDYVLTGDDELPDNWNGGSTGGTTDHTQLINRSVEDQHPMTAISGLTAQFTTVPSAKITEDQINSLLP